jgi:urease accessory protein
VTESPDLSRTQLDLSFARRGERTVLERRRFRWPFVLTRTFALDSRPRHMLTVIVQTSSGALHGEDRLSQRFEVGENAAAHVTTQGASAVHRASSGLESRDSVRLSVAQGGFLEYLPEPRILFPGAALEQTLEIECAPGGTALVGDAFTIHDMGCSGRGFRRFRSAMILRCGGDPVLVDRMDINALGAGKSASFRAFASLVLAAPGSGRSIAPLADELSASLALLPGLYGAASLLPAKAGVGVRLAGRELRDVRAGIATIWFCVRSALYGAPPESRRKGDDAASILEGAPSDRTRGSSRTARIDILT